MILLLLLITTIVLVIFFVIFLLYNYNYNATKCNNPEYYQDSTKQLNKKIAICMWYDDGIKEYADYTHKINSIYAAKNGFDLFYSNKRKLKDRKPHWERFPMMKDIIVNYKNKYDYVMWIDADAFFVLDNKYYDLSKILEKYKEYDVIFSADKCDNIKKRLTNIFFNIPVGAYINSGVIIMKTNDYSIKLLDMWMSEESFENRDKSWQDQGAIRYTWEIDWNNLRERSAILPLGTMQTFGNGACAKKALIKHMAGKSSKTREKIVKKEWERIS